ncbi:MAG TPA: hypothetical protein VL979_00655 [Solirubrobacteraceae bacterium]|nr:hypothetical protein [Solirubrobacteraceae bacterium]
MAVLVVILTLLVLAAVLAVISAPIRAARARREAAGGAAPAGGDAEEALAARTLEDLEAAREAKYREIRDAELDYRTGKLSREDYGAIDAELRAEAIEILDRLERLKPTDA